MGELPNKFKKEIYSEADEAERIRELKRLQLENTAPEEAFDRIIQTAEHIFQVPVALMSVITKDRQWFKSSTGLPAELLHTKSTPREISFCQHVVARKSPLIVEDTLQDDFFKDNPLVKSIGIRFYAGVPIFSSNCYILGTICIIDTKPRVFDKKDIMVLRNLGAWTTSELELRETRHLLTRVFSSSQIVSDESSIVSAMATTERLALQLGFSEQESAMLKLAVDEACTNALRHGKVEACQLYWNVSPLSMEIVLYQEGELFSIVRRELPSHAVDGRGILLIQSIMDDTILYDNGGQTELRMAKRLHNTSEGIGNE
jgi:GAF domain-containing protein